jgi:hypothetical protein
MAATSVNLTIDKGTDFEATFNLSNSDSSIANLSGASIVARIKKHPTATSYKSFSSTITIATGKVKISMAASVTSELTSGRNYYDIILTDGSGTVSKVIQGMVLVNDSVSS